jgi:two-component sensor histidine kinase
LSEPDPGRVHFGFRIVTNLAAALGGTFERVSRDGFTARVRFPLVPAANAAN